jgi:hypothetical protein
MIHLARTQREAAFMAFMERQILDLRERVMSRDDNYVWNGTDQSGASLTAMTRLGLEKGYTLVGCDISGVNSFFVRKDLAGDYFAEPFTAENYYHPPR